MQRKLRPAFESRVGPRCDLDALEIVSQVMNPDSFLRIGCVSIEVSRRPGRMAAGDRHREWAIVTMKERRAQRRPYL